MLKTGTDLKSTGFKIYVLASRPWSLLNRAEIWSMLQIFIGAAAHLKHNKKDQYLNYKACLLILQAHMISTQSTEWGLQRWKHFRGKNNSICKYSPCTFQVTREYAWHLCVSTPARQSRGSLDVSCTTAANMRSAYWEPADEDKHGKTGGQHATSSSVWAWHFPSLPHISCIKDEENEVAQAEALSRFKRKSPPSQCLPCCEQKLQ